MTGVRERRTAEEVVQRERMAERAVLLLGECVVVVKIIHDVMRN